MEYWIRKARTPDLERIRQIYAMARQFMANHGNPDQWGSTYPSEEMLRQDITQQKLYAVCENEQIHGVFYFAREEDPTYAEIYEGGWHCSLPYGVIHRIAGDGSGGILRTAVRFAEQQATYLRIDTHQNNFVMQRALEKLKFRRCGIIFVEDGTPRIAYDK